MNPEARELASQPGLPPEGSELAYDQVHWPDHIGRVLDYSLSNPGSVMQGRLPTEDPVYPGMEVAVSPAAAHLSRGDRAVRGTWEVVLKEAAGEPHCHKLARFHDVESGEPFYMIKVLERQSDGTESWRAPAPDEVARMSAAMVGMAANAPAEAAVSPARPVRIRSWLGWIAQAQTRH